jgi:hypothetical protein
MQIPDAIPTLNAREIIIPAIVAVIGAASNVLTYYITRGKIKSETKLNVSVADKNEAETIKALVEIIDDLREQIGQWIASLKLARGDYESIALINSELKETVEKVRDESTDKLRALHRACEKEKEALKIQILRAIDAMNNLVKDDAINALEQKTRMQAVGILETLYQVRDRLEK